MGINEMKWERNHVEIKEPILEYLERIFDEEIKKNHKLEVWIGTDSCKKGSGYNFATVIVVRMTEDLGGVTVGRCGMIIYSKYHHSFKAVNKAGVNERMVYEVGKSVGVAYELAPLLDLYDVPLEIHADINADKKHESNRALGESIGYILGMGYQFKIKPEALAASYAADRMC